MKGAGILKLQKSIYLALRLQLAHFLDRLHELTVDQWYADFALHNITGGVPIPNKLEANLYLLRVLAAMLARLDHALLSSSLNTAASLNRKARAYDEIHDTSSLRFVKQSATLRALLLDFYRTVDWSDAHADRMRHVLRL